ATADISNPPIDKIGKLAFVPFAELTPAIEIAPSDGENASFPWLWIALPVGAVVIAGGAAFVLLRKKRKSSPTP
ncbi:MAG: LPXTG cell wall anchor domain-containing protein, partial [Clostridia bacterium]|nr:LPXTG cell wall anchor domain-containing protein [Clostridia bacterium]